MRGKNLLSRERAHDDGKQILKESTSEPGKHWDSAGRANSRDKREGITDEGIENELNHLRGEPEGSCGTGDDLRQTNNTA